MVQKGRAARGRAAAVATLVAVPLLAVFLAIGNEPLSTFVFDGDSMQQIARDAIRHADALNVGVMSPGDGAREKVILDHVVQSLQARYGEHILPEPRWIFNNAGGAMGAMLVLHCSLSEYVILFGTALGTEGHTGRFLADDYFTILYGEQWAFPAGSLTKEIYRPGDQHWLPRYTSKQYKMPDSCWALEYARGNILSMIPFGLLDTFTSTADVVPLAQTIYVSAYGMVREMIRGKF
ncbi:C-8 sterol isomerase [Porphyridium purpureum]|uniref:C-8 sterol isomerase n=1 Tax=Porphyridium purpureum TaxID=35688 RepID=A0A5J4Z0V6_PORPP|nr:C-8 sterol isomerase [Porphyridium purpureum]|eukprot:POR0050..scf208_2